ncbi:MAG: helix-hairpin-helix domain-containing protein [Calditrichia bacterium]
MKKSIIRMSYIFVAIVLPLLLFFGSAAAQDSTQVYTPQHQLDINNASFEQIAILPVPESLAGKIYDRITYQGPLQSVYDLNKIAGMTPALFLKIKPLIKIEPYQQKTEREERIENLYYKLEQWEGNEGINQSLIDLWIEQALEPININRITYDQLLNLQNVTPVDAAAIINYRHQVGKISSERDLRSAPYLSYYGFRNASDFVSFEAPKPHMEFHGHYMMQMDDSPFMSAEAEATAQIPTAEILPERINNNYPNVYTRFMGSLGPNIHFGYSYYHSLDEPFLYANTGVAEIPKGKVYLGIENQQLGPVELRKLYVGNYSLAFGQGVVMENTDYFLPRKSGFGFRKRFLGLSGDNSRTREFKLTGAAAELKYRNAHVFLFGAFDKRDAILNRTPVLINGKEQYTMNQLIVLDQRFQYAPGDEARQKLGLDWRNNVSELLYGTHFAYDFKTATQLGFTYYESAYNRLIRPDLTEIADPNSLNTIKLSDNEIYNSYGGPVSDGENPLWGDAKSFRRVYGFDFQTVYQNVALQGEYAELDKSKGFLSGNPHALVASAYVQYNSFSLLGLYRDYSLGFDNPYQRSFSNYQRFKRTIYENYYYLQDPLYGQLYTNNPQPQAERGFYLNSRYQINRETVLSLEYDNWRRVSDDATQHRLVGSVTFRPIFPLNINLRQKFQGREVLNNSTTEYFENYEFRGLVRLRLSRFDELGMLYMNSLTKFRPRPRFLFPVQTGESLQYVNVAGNIGSPAEAIGGIFTHNFNEWLKLRGFIGYYKGFFWNFEDTQFQVMDSMKGATRFWISLYTRVNSQLSMRFKYTKDYQQPVNFIEARESTNVPITTPGKYYAANLVQPTQNFYYLEFNFHF